MKRPGGGIGGHVGSRCVHRFFDGFGLKWSEMDTARRCHIKPSSSAKADDPVFQSGCDRTGKSRRTGYPAFAGYDSQCPACFPSLLAPNMDREIGGGGATRQPGQVRKEAALTRSGSGRSSVSYLFFERIAQDGLPRPALDSVPVIPQAGFETQPSADRSVTDAGGPLMPPNVSESAHQGGFVPGGPPEAGKHYRVLAR